MADYDLVIRGGTIVDGTGAEPLQGDVAISGGRIVDVGRITGKGAEEIDAAGLLVTPGFVDIHTHYDGQVTWENRLKPSSAHGVTTVVMGNCGVGFAPCRTEDRDTLVELMEGVEDIPEVVMTTGLPWKWETFPEYLDFVDQRQFDVDVAAYLPHSALRVYVMGERGALREDATDSDLAEMRRLTREAMDAGALGFATSRSIFHRDIKGKPVPTKDSVAPELSAIAAGMEEAGHGVVEALIDFVDADAEFGKLRMMAEDHGRPVTFTVAQVTDWPRGWERAVELLHQANADGLPMKGQVIGRPTGLLLGLDLSFHPFTLSPSYKAIAALPLAERLERMRDPDLRARIIAEEPEGAQLKLLEYIRRFDRLFELGDPPDYAPPLERSVAAIAERQGVSPLEVAYDLLTKGDGTTMLFLPVGNYYDGNLDVVTALLKDENCLLGLGDGGAHYGVICDAGYPTFMLTYWGRDKDGERLTVPHIVKALSHDTAAFVGLDDRGVIAPGYKADLNIIDFDRLHLHAPHPVWDLPAGGRRLVQNADGYVVTIVNGEVTYRNGEPTAALPGRLVRGPQVAALLAEKAVQPA